MPYRQGDTTYAFEAKIEHATLKAYLIEMTLGGKYWLPKSQIAKDDDDNPLMSEPDADGNRSFEVTEWWWDRKTEVA